MQTQLKVKLSFFNFLQYFIWGSWYVSMGAYLSGTLKFGGQEIGAAYGAFAIGSMISPFFVGLIADRYFASEKMLAVLALLGGAALCLLPRFDTFLPFYSTLIIYCALFTPTLALGNSLALNHLKDAKTAFPRVKLWSAVGWIGGGVTLTMLKGEQSSIQFYLAGCASIALAIFSLSLPHTPPQKTGKDVGIGELLGLDALSLMKKPSFAIFISCMFLICIPLYFYFVMMGIYLTEIGWTRIAGKMSLAQVSDVIFMLMLPIMLKRLGYKKTIFLGILAWCARYFFLAGSVSLAAMSAPLIFVAILLHGVCYDFLFIAGQLYVDDQANPRIRAACQGFIAFILWGVGAFVGTMIAGKVLAMYEITNSAGAIVHDWAKIWQVPAFLSVAVLLVFAIFFREPPRKAEL
ncbi:MAG: MFS transporter [Verrucomicrobia bacterium]|nr:MFS transporter [Verrucomicrobiota bacterium]MDA1066460.1 MFS transporter [Verrucomicrobiota bacterium]